ncbi:hypothetical protein CAPTEDRAFT_195363 [Capitella teleta]|uniref:DUF659 domain-containing protein n=1 Tax=Capitella teleta TaxID=283909 RepID=R7TD63_CAPTE|nr:hypothetical protein CAPTEDRAFT_195363 [Capitella teleta]|eukprot:ELT91427.1 hypothetical protein CAPTEDRAFT_195363 [Capitella teleta]
MHAYTDYTIAVLSYSFPPCFIISIKCSLRTQTLNSLGSLTALTFQNFPVVSDQAICAKLEKALKLYEWCRKKQKFEELDEISDVTKLNGQWLNKEDEKLFKLQIETKGQVGYSTGKPASPLTIHPSKRRKPAEASSSAQDCPKWDTVSCDSSDTSEESDWEKEPSASPGKREHNPTGVARRLVTGAKLSTHGAARVCRQLSGEGKALPAPSQPAIHKAIYKRAAEVKQHLVNTLHQEKWSLHFDGKHFDGLEHQGVVLKNEEREIKLAVLRLKDGKAATIVQGLKGVLEEFNLWGSVLMIIANITSVNTGKEKGVVIRLQKMFESLGHPRPRFISCQHHVLDRILRVAMDSELMGKTKSPNIEYFFVKDLMENYEQLKAGFSNGKAVIQESSGWRGDIKFLFHLTFVTSWKTKSSPL